MYMKGLGGRGERTYRDSELEALLGERLRLSCPERPVDPDLLLV